MAENTSRFNQGKFTSTDIDEQYNDEYWSKGAKTEAMKQRIFTQLGDRLTQPKHWGDIIKKERQFPILHELNRIDCGIDATTATIITDTFYAYNASGTPVPDAVNFTEGYIARNFGGVSTPTLLAVAQGLAETAATAAAGAGGKVLNGTGTLYGGDADHNTVVSSFPTLTEDGGNVNAVNTKAITVKASVEEFGVHIKYTQRSLDMGTRLRTLAIKTRDLGEMKGDIKEAQVQADLLAAGQLNATYGGVVALSQAALEQSGVLTFTDLRAVQMELKRLRVPRNTKIITGSKKIDTKVISKAYYVYVGQELTPTLEDMTHNGVNVFQPVETYADAASSMKGQLAAGTLGLTATGEIGRIGSFRFIEVENMQKYMGAGAENGAGGADTTGFNASKNATGNEAFDVFPMLFVGSDSFATVGFEGDSARIKNASPKADAHNDPFGKKGSMSIAWWHGTLVYRPERIHCLNVTALIS